VLRAVGKDNPKNHGLGTSKLRTPNPELRTPNSELRTPLDTRHPTLGTRHSLMSGSITLILGGSRSGKSRRAESLAGREAMAPVTYVATCATALMDDEMRCRVQQHRRHRPAHWCTIENRFDLPELIAENNRTLLLIDCLTLWLSHGWITHPDEACILAELERALQIAAVRDGALILVSNELGMGLVPADARSRGFRDLCGRANQVAAAYAQRVEFMVAGLPLVLKGGTGQP